MKHKSHQDYLAALPHETHLYQTVLQIYTDDALPKQISVNVADVIHLGDVESTVTIV